MILTTAETHVAASASGLSAVGFPSLTRKDTCVKHRVPPPGSILLFMLEVCSAIRLMNSSSTEHAE